MMHSMAEHFASLCEGADSFFVSSAGYTCSTESISSLSPFPSAFNLTQEKIVSILSHQSFDHFLPSCNTPSEAADTSVLFTSLTSDLSSWFSALPTYCESSSVVLRFFHSASSKPIPQSRVGGYGIALDIKNTEYKVIDDRTKEGTLFQNPDEVIAELNTDVDGFYFSTLQKRYPSLTDALQQFKESLHVSAQSITPLQMKDLGLKLVQKVIRSQNPIRQLEESVMDAPAVAASLARIPVSEEVREEAKKVAETFGEEEGKVYLNGKRLRFDSTSFNFFQTMETVRGLLAFQKELTTRNLTRAMCDDIRAIVRASLTSPSNFRFSLQAQNDPAILWLNNIERDPSYSRFSKSIRQFFSSSFILPPVRANYLSRVFVLDPSEDYRELYQTLFEVIQQRIPIRCGFLFSSAHLRERCHATCTPTSWDPNTPIDAVQLGQLGIELLQSDAKHMFLVFFFNFFSQPDRSTQAAVKLFDNIVGEERARELLEEGEHLAPLARMVEKVGALGLSEGYEMVNGRVFALQSFQQFMNEAYGEIGLIIDGIEKKELAQVSEVPAFLAKSGFVGEVYDKKLYAPFKDQVFVEVSESDVRGEGAVCIREGGPTTVILSITAAALPSFSSIVDLSDYSLYLTTHDTSLLLLLSLLRALHLHGLDDTVSDVVACAAKTGVSLGALEQCVNVYLEEEDVEKLGDSWKTDESVEKWNSRMAGYFGEELSVIVNGRLFALSSMNALSALLQMDRVLSVPLQERLPECVSATLMNCRYSMLSLLPFIHSHLDVFTADIPSLPSSLLLLNSTSTPNSPSTSNSPSPSLHFTAVLDPFTTTSQRFLAFLHSLHPLLSFSYSLLLLPHTDYSDLPLKRSYRYVLSSDRIATWLDLPPEHLYTMSVETPFKWSVVSYYAECDLDNLRVLDENTFILAQYIVEGIVMEGSCSNVTETPTPAQGVMLELTEVGKEGVVSDTVVMNNRGYWQLKGDMGVFEIRVNRDSPDLGFVDGNRNPVDSVNVENRLDCYH